MTILHSFNHERWCPKCLSHMRHAKHFRAVPVESRKNECGETRTTRAVPEHLEITCGMCDYSWFETPADAKKGGKDA